MGFNKNVIKYLKENKITKAELAKAVGIPYTTLDSMLKRNSDSSRVATIYKIAEYLGVSLEELVFDKNTKSDDTATYTEEEKRLIVDFRHIDSRGKSAVLSTLRHELSVASSFNVALSNKAKRSIPLYTAPAAAGEALPLLTDDFMMIETDEAPQEASFGIRISGDSMEPLIKNGSVVWIKKQESINNGEIGVFILNGESLCKKIDNSNGECHLISLNKKYKPIEILETDDIRVVGRVLI